MSLAPGAAPDRFAASLRDQLGGRAWLVLDPETGRYRASSPRLQELASFLDDDERACGHEAVFLATGRGSGALFAAVVHSTVRGQAQGGLRLAPYRSAADLLGDGLRLSRAMTRKNALAHLWWGGGKGLIARPGGDRGDDPGFRRVLYQEYGAFVSSLRGCYVTAEDAGTGPEDLREVFRATRFATCIPPEYGGSGNPSPATARGVLCAMEAALRFVGLGGLAGQRVAVQGLGRVGAALVEGLVEAGVASVVASDTHAERCASLRERFAGLPVEIRHAEPGDDSILAEPGEVLAPCALGGALSPKTIPDVRAKIVCGAANNMLEDTERDGAALAERGILYVPDFVANRMGIVWCGNEQYGRLESDPDLERHLDPAWEGSIPATVHQVLSESALRGSTPVAEACRLADDLATRPHPLWPGRSARIIASLTTHP